MKSVTDLRIHTVPQAWKTDLELTCSEAITKILELCSEEYDESPEFVLDGESIIGKSADGKHILMYDAFSGIFDVFTKR